MSGDERLRRLHADLSPRPVEDDPAGMYWAVIDAIVRLTFELTSAIAAVDFPEAVRARDELELALLHADVLAGSLPDGPERAEALQQLRELHAIAKRQLAMGPAPTLAAVEAADASDESLWCQEAQTWIAARLACGVTPQRFAPISSSSHSRRRPVPSDARPGTPRALHDAPNRLSDDIPVSTLAASPLADNVGAR